MLLECIYYLYGLQIIADTIKKRGITPCVPEFDSLNIEYS